MRVTIKLRNYIIRPPIHSTLHYNKRAPLSSGSNNSSANQNCWQESSASFLSNHNDNINNTTNNKKPQQVSSSAISINHINFIFLPQSKVAKRQSRRKNPQILLWPEVAYFIHLASPTRHRKLPSNKFTHNCRRLNSVYDTIRSFVRSSFRPFVFFFFFFFCFLMRWISRIQSDSFGHKGIFEGFLSMRAAIVPFFFEEEEEKCHLLPVTQSLILNAALWQTWFFIIIAL